MLDKATDCPSTQSMSAAVSLGKLPTPQGGISAGSGSSGDPLQRWNNGADGKEKRQEADLTSGSPSPPGSGNLLGPEPAKCMTSGIVRSSKITLRKYR